MNIFKEKYCRFNCVALTVSVLLYFLNQIIIKNIFRHALFFHCYFNDVVAPVGVLSFLNFSQSIKGRGRIESWRQLVGFGIACSVCWEWVATYIKPSSTFDMWDIVAYFSGIFIYQVALLHKKYQEKGGDFQ